MKKLFRLSAFTLAEILVVLAIMGTIVAITLPPLKAHTDEKKFVSLTQKAFKEISEATARLEVTYGNTEFWNWTAYAPSSEENYGGPDLVRSWYKSIMNVNPDNAVVLKTDIPYKKLDGEGIGASMRRLGTFITADGFCWQIGGDVQNPKPYATVDVNCNQDPNIMGIDVHSFNITNDGVVPAGTPGSTNWHGGDAWNCTAYVIKYGKMPWLNSRMTSCPSL